MEKSQRACKALRESEKITKERGPFKEIIRRRARRIAVNSAVKIEAKGDKEWAKEPSGKTAAAPTPQSVREPSV